MIRSATMLGSAMVVSSRISFFNIQQVWVYFQFPGSLNLFPAALGAVSICFAWQFSSGKGRPAALGALFIAISAITMIIFCFASITPTI
jgi:hypothetical protein